MYKQCVRQFREHTIYYNTTVPIDNRLLNISDYIT